MKLASAARLSRLDKRRGDEERDTEATARTVIFIRDLAVQTTIGVHAKERRKTRMLSMDIDLELDASLAARTDALADTVDYAAVVDDLREVLQTMSCHLLELLADLVAQRLIEHFGARRVWVQVAKVGILKDVSRVGVRLERTSFRPAPPATKVLRPVARRPRASR